MKRWQVCCRGGNLVFTINWPLSTETENDFYNTRHLFNCSASDQKCSIHNNRLYKHRIMNPTSGEVSRLIHTMITVFRVSTLCKSHLGNCRIHSVGCCHLHTHFPSLYKERMVLLWFTKHMAHYHSKLHLFILISDIHLLQYTQYLLCPTLDSPSY